jgi:excisionase family DNA binding protein
VSISSTAGALPVSLTREEEVEPLVVKPKVAWKLLACSNTRGYELIAAGELESFRDGRSRKITVASIHRYIAQRLAAAEKAASAALQPRRGRGRPRQHRARGEIA